MQEVDFASLTAREAAPDPTSPDCGADMELYMRDCRQLLDLGLKRWGGDAPGRLGPRVLNPDEPHDIAMIKGMFAPQPEARDGEADAGLPRLQTPQLQEPAPQLQQQQRALLPAQPAPPQALQPPAPPSSSSGEAPASAAGSATDAPQPMEVEVSPAPAQTEAPPLLVPPSAPRGLDLDGLVSQLRDVLAAAPLDEAMVRHVLDGLEGLGLSGQALEDAGAPPTAHMPGVPAHLHRAHPPAQLPTLHPLTAPHRRVQPGQQASGRERRQAWGVCAAQNARRRAVRSVDVGRRCRLKPAVHRCAV